MNEETSGSFLDLKTGACQVCGSVHLSSGYGLAAGPLGAYIYCDGCEHLILFDADMNGLPEFIGGEEAITRIKKFVKEWKTAIQEEIQKRQNG